MTAVFAPGVMDEAPRLARHMTIGTLMSLPKTSNAPETLDAQLESLYRSGVEALRDLPPQMVPNSQLAHVEMGRIDAPDEAARHAIEDNDQGLLFHIKIADLKIQHDILRSHAAIFSTNNIISQVMR